METFLRSFRAAKRKLLIAVALLATLSFVWMGHAYAQSGEPARDGRLVTVYDRGTKRVILTHASSVHEALQDAHIDTAPADIVEPAIDSELVATDYVVNIYRARPVVVVDGVARQKVITAAQTPRDIVAATDLTKLHSEDTATFTASTDILTDGASTILTINRAKAFTLQMYGKPIQAYSHAATVGEMLHDKGIDLTDKDTLSVEKDEPLRAGMTVAIWREGAQTTTIEESITFSVRKVLDFDHPIGYHAVRTPGVNGIQEVTYEIIAQNGREVSRKVIQKVIVHKPTEQIEIVGAKPGPDALSKSKGAHYWTDSNGVSHRETYYDLPMNVVIGACGGGDYTVRADGAKIDKDGYILVAANYGNYPRCSIVETSMGLGKVYDTGGFAVRHPHGFDLATDWTNYDGR